MSMFKMSLPIGESVSHFLNYHVDSERNYNNILRVMNKCCFNIAHGEYASVRHGLTIPTDENLLALELITELNLMDCKQFLKTNIEDEIGLGSFILDAKLAMKQYMESVESYIGMFEIFKFDIEKVFLNRVFLKKIK